MKRLSEIYECRLGSNLLYTFGGRLSAVWEIRAWVSKKKPPAKYKGLPTYVGHLLVVVVVIIIVIIIIRTLILP